MVAKSYAELEQVGEPYLVNGKMYVKVLKNGAEKQVRWYTEAEYRKMYPDAVVEEKSVFKSQHDILGFQKGYITIFKGDTYANLSWFHQSNARYCKWWGWYVVSTEDVPEDIPCGIEPIRLDWEGVGKEDGSLKSDAVVGAYVDSLVYEPSSSEFVGEVGERLELFLTVDRAIALNNAFGESTMHIMHDDDGNIFVWTTSSKCWAEGSERHIRGTVKDHRVYKNVNQTILNRCVEVKN